jgi:hypothetical protein
MSEDNQVSASTGPIPITQDQYNDFSNYNKTWADIPTYSPDYSIPFNE